MGQLYSDQTNCCCVNAHCCLIFQNEIRNPDFFLWNVPMFKTLRAKQSMSSCLQDEFACKTTSLWSLNLEYQTLHCTIKYGHTNSCIHPPHTHIFVGSILFQKKLKEAFSLSLWTLWIFSIFLKRVSLMLSVWTNHLTT